MISEAAHAALEQKELSITAHCAAAQTWDLTTLLAFTVDGEKKRHLADCAVVFCLSVVKVLYLQNDKLESEEEQTVCLFNRFSKRI